MSKILLVEDDQNLSEIYNARLAAEGYEVLGASNGEDALAIAAKEKPELVISDVMMPRVSGFEMLDILRHTDGMQGVKIIMLTALGQDNDRSKASELGADRYLVKSQVTLEDIVSAAKELLGDAVEPATAPAPAASPASTTDASTPPAVTSIPAEPSLPPTPAPAASPAPVATPAAASQTSSTPAAPTGLATDIAATPSPTTVANQPDTASAPATGTPASVAGNPLPTGPIARQEAELKEQLGVSPSQGPTTSDFASQAPSSTEPTTAVPAAETASPTDNSPQPAAEAEAPETPSGTTDSSMASHDEVLAAALKELDSEQNISTPAPEPAESSTPDQAQPQGSRRVIMPLDSTDSSSATSNPATNEPAIESTQPPVAEPSQEPASPTPGDPQAAPAQSPLSSAEAPSPQASSQPSPIDPNSISL